GKNVFEVNVDPDEKLLTHNRQQIFDEGVLNGRTVQNGSGQLRAEPFLGEIRQHEQWTGLLCPCRLNRSGIVRLDDGPVRLHAVTEHTDVRQPVGDVRNDCGTAVWTDSRFQVCVAFD